MATVNLVRNNYTANGSVTAGTVDSVVCTDFLPAFGLTVGVFAGEEGSVVVSLNPAVSGTVGAAAGGEPAFAGKDVFLPAEMMTANGRVTTIYVTSTSGTVNYWVSGY
jgi:hypothetical protein